MFSGRWNVFLCAILAYTIAAFITVITQAKGQSLACQHQQQEDGGKVSFGKSQFPHSHWCCDYNFNPPGGSLGTF